MVTATGLDHQHLLAARSTPFGLNKTVGAVHAGHTLEGIAIWGAANDPVLGPERQAAEQSPFWLDNGHLCDRCRKRSLHGDGNRRVS